MKAIKMGLQVRSISNKVDKIMKSAPHLPKDWRKTLSNNLWWIIATMAIVLALVAFTLFFSFLSSISLLSMSTQNFGYYVPVGRSLNSVILTGITMTEAIVAMVFLLMSVTGLKQMKRSGWEILFVTLGIYMIIAVANVIMHGVGGAIGYILSILISLYLLFEIRVDFRISGERKRRGE